MFQHEDPLLTGRVFEKKISGMMFILTNWLYTRSVHVVWFVTEPMVLVHIYTQKYRTYVLTYL